MTISENRWATVVVVVVVVVAVVMVRDQLRADFQFQFATSRLKCTTLCPLALTAI